MLLHQSWVTLPFERRSGRTRWRREERERERSLCSFKPLAHRTATNNSREQRAASAVPYLSLMDTRSHRSGHTPKHICPQWWEGSHTDNDRSGRSIGPQTRKYHNEVMLPSGLSRCHVFIFCPNFIPTWPEKKTPPVQVTECVSIQPVSARLTSGTINVQQEYLHV